jgi:SAM-dependent methyltransferase
MLLIMDKVIEKFWKTRKEYPPFIYKSQRRYLDLGIILEYIEGVDSILDLGCGEGQILLMLRELADIKNYYGYDLSQVFISNLIKRWGNYPGLETKVINFTTVSELPETDMCVCMGAMPYVLDDNDLKHMLSKIKSKAFICRVPCNLEPDRLEIDKFSKEFDADYAAVYRTISEYIDILSESFNIKSIDRCYPDEIESKYGSKQFFFVCGSK